MNSHCESFAMSQRGSVGLILKSSIPSIIPLTSVELYMWMSITELGCTVCVISGASAKTGSTLSLLSLIYVIAETTRRVVENACTSKSEQEVFNREAFFFFCEIFCFGFISHWEMHWQKDNVQCSNNYYFFWLRPLKFLAMGRLFYSLLLSCKRICWGFFLQLKISEIGVYQKTEFSTMLSIQMLPFTSFVFLEWLELNLYT